MNRSTPLSSPLSGKNFFCRSWHAWFMRIGAKKSAVGTNARNCSLNWLVPAGMSTPSAPGKVRNAGTSMPSRPGPSLRMCIGVPSEARDDRCRPSMWPTRPSPVNVAFCVALAGVNVPALSCASAAAEPVPWNTLLM